MPTQILTPTQTELTSPNLQELDLTELARGVVQEYGTGRKSHPLIFDGMRPCPVLGHRELLTRLLLTLLQNAVTYSKAGRYVGVSVWQSGTTVYLAVEDQGIGTSTANTERFSLPYRKLDLTRDRTDLGARCLTTVQNIADAHGALISVQGDLERGTTFELCFKAKLLDDVPD